MEKLELALTLSESSVQTRMNAASDVMINCCVTTSVTTTLVVSTAPVVMATCYTPTTGPAEVRMPGYWRNDLPRQQHCQIQVASACCQMLWWNVVVLWCVVMCKYYGTMWLWYVLCCSGKFKSQLLSNSKCCGGVMWSCGVLLFWDLKLRCYGVLCCQIGDFAPNWSTFDYARRRKKEYIGQGIEFGCFDRHLMGLFFIVKTTHIHTFNKKN